GGYRNDWQSATFRATVVAAHKADFDRTYLRNDDRPWICTYRCSIKEWPDAPSHTNQALRYWLALQPDIAAATRAQRDRRGNRLAAHARRYAEAVTRRRSKRCRSTRNHLGGDRCGELSTKMPFSTQLVDPPAASANTVGGP